MIAIADLVSILLVTHLAISTAEPCRIIGELVDGSLKLNAQDFCECMGFSRLPDSDHSMDDKDCTGHMKPSERYLDLSASEVCNCAGYNVTERPTTMPTQKKGDAIVKEAYNVGNAHDAKTTTPTAVLFDDGRKTTPIPAIGGDTVKTTPDAEENIKAKTTNPTPGVEGGSGTTAASSKEDVGDGTTTASSKEDVGDGTTTPTPEEHDTEKKTPAPGVNGDTEKTTSKKNGKDHTPDKLRGNETKAAAYPVWEVLIILFLSLAAGLFVVYASQMLYKCCKAKTYDVGRRENTLEMGGANAN